MNEKTNAWRSPSIAWLAVVVPPLIPLCISRSHDPRVLALCCFFAASVAEVVYAFRAGASGRQGKEPALAWNGSWRKELTGLARTLLLQWFVFASALLLNDSKDLVAPVLALLSLVPSLTIAPFLTLATGRPFPATVFTLFAVGCMKMVAGAVTVSVYGWHADAQGRTTLTWTEPNLIVCAFAVSTLALCLTCFAFGQRHFAARSSGRFLIPKGSN